MNIIEMKIGKPQHEWQLNFEGDWPTSIAFLGDSKTLVAGNRSGQILLWNLTENIPEQAADAKQPDDRPPNQNPIRIYKGHTNTVTHLRALPGGKGFVSSSFDHSIGIWKTDRKSSGTEEIVLDASERKTRASRAKKEDRDGILNAPGITLEQIEPDKLIDKHQGWVFGLDVDSNGTRMISGDDKCFSVAWDIESRKPISSWTGYDRVWVRSAAISPDGKTAFTCEYADRRSNFDVPAAQARLWDVDTGKMKKDLLKVWTPKVKDEDRVDSYGYRQTWSKLIKRGLVAAAFSPNGKLLALGQGGETDTGKVHLVDVESGEILRSVSGHRYGICDVKFSADGKYVLSSGRDTTVRICQVSDGKEVAALGKSRGGQFKDWIHAISISPDQKYVAGADIAGFIHVWKL